MGLFFPHLFLIQGGGIRAWHNKVGINWHGGSCQNVTCTSWSCPYQCSLASGSCLDQGKIGAFWTKGGEYVGASSKKAVSAFVGVKQALLQVWDGFCTNYHLWFCRFLKSCV